MNMPVTLTEAIDYITAAQARGGRVMCGQCRQPASLALACDDGTFQGVACTACFASHRDFMEISMIAIASGMAEAACCSRCGADSVGPNHIITKGI